jgi:hypothetical protein
MDLNSQLKDAYKSLNEKVVHSVSADDVMDFLFQSGVLPENKYLDLCDGPEGSKKTRKLMAFLHTVGHPEAFIKFHEAIIARKLSYEWLMKEIDNICTHKQQTNAKSAAAKPKLQGKITESCHKNFRC